MSIRSSSESTLSQSENPVAASGLSAPSSHSGSVARRLAHVAVYALERHPLLVVFMLAVFVRLGYVLEVMDSPVWYWERWQQSDMDTFLRVARQIQLGDLLVSSPYHPLHNSHKVIASAEVWESWYPPHAFYHVPGYYYYLASLLTVFNGSLTAIKLTQVLIGAGHAMLLGAVGQKIMGRLGGLCVGLLAALYAPFIVVEPLLLREGLGLVLAAGGLYLVLRADTLDHESSRLSTYGSWFVAGGILGLGAMTKETGLVLFVGIAVWVLARTRGEQRQVSWLAIGGLFSGFAAGISPLMIRNLAVGAPVFALSAPGVITFAVANAADAPYDGVLWLVPPSLREIMEQSHGRLWATMEATLRTYGSAPELLLLKAASKFSAIWINVEIPDNFSYDYFTRFSSLLRILPRFAWVWLLAVLGLTMWLATRGFQKWSRIGKRGWGSSALSAVPVPFSSAALGLVATCMGVHVAAQCLMPVMSRYRLVIVPFLMLLAGWALAQGCRWLFHRRWMPFGIEIVTLLVIASIWVSWPSRAILANQAIRPIDVIFGAGFLAQQGKWIAARKEFEAGEAYFEARGLEAQRVEVTRKRDQYDTYYNRL